jgi:hypothetical protein
MLAQAAHVSSACTGNWQAAQIATFNVDLALRSGDRVESRRNGPAERLLAEHRDLQPTRASVPTVSV